MTKLLWVWKLLKVGWKWAAGAVLLWLCYLGFYKAWDYVALENPAVKAVVQSVAVKDSLIVIQNTQLQTFEAEVKEWHAENEALRAAKLASDTQHQINAKELINRAVYAEKQAAMQKAEKERCEAVTKAYEKNAPCYGFSPTKRSDFKKAEKWVRYLMDCETKERI